MAFEMRGKKALSPIISSVIVVVVIITSTFIVLTILQPSFEKGREMALIGEGKQALSSIDSAIKEILFEAPGAKRTVTLKATEGNFRLSSRGDTIKFIMDTHSDVMEVGSVKEEGDITVSYGPTLRAYEDDIDNDGQTDLVMENNAVVFAVRKLHSSSSPGFINTTNISHPIITLMENKRLNSNVTPVFGVYINDFDFTSYGTGYTELIETGNRLSEAKIRMFVNSSNATQTIAYEVFFSLRAAQDFVKTEVMLR